MENFNAERGTHLVNAGAIHYEPMGIYAGQSDSLENIPDGAVIAVPNDATNEGRALLLSRTWALPMSIMVFLPPEPAPTALPSSPTPGAPSSPTPVPSPSWAPLWLKPPMTRSQNA